MPAPAREHGCADRSGIRVARYGIEAPRVIRGGDQRQQVKIRNGIPDAALPARSRHRLIAFGAFSLSGQPSRRTIAADLYGLPVREHRKGSLALFPTSVPSATGIDPVSDKPKAGIEANGGAQRHWPSYDGLKDRWMETARVYGSLLGRLSLTKGERYELAAYRNRP